MLILDKRKKARKEKKKAKENTYINGIKMNTKERSLETYDQ